MFQTFESASQPELGPARLSALRDQMRAEGLDAYLVPRADAYQGEYVAPCDERLAWLTGFTGSAGFAIVLHDQAGVFVDGRYRVQIRAQIDPCFTPVDWPEIKAGDWLAQTLGQTLKSGRIGFDPWLHTRREIDEMARAGLTLTPCANLIDRIWADRPAPPCAPARAHPEATAGEPSTAKRARISRAIAPARACLLTLPDSIAWLLNLRGGDIARNPLLHAMAVLFDTGHLTLFTDPEKLAGLDLGPEVTLRPAAAMIPALRSLQGPVRLDPATAPLQIGLELEAAGVAILAAADPCLLPKACKNPSEIKGMQAAHLRDGVAMVEHLAWLSEAQDLTEIDVVTHLERTRAASGQLLDLSFDTICGAGPNGAIVHYRVTTASNRALNAGEVLLLDSGGQYPDGTTDITRTQPIGPADLPAFDPVRAPYTAVLKGLIALSSARFARGCSGGHLDALARTPLWALGLDYDHGTGHGVGAALSVHEGPARISRLSDIPLEIGMILSIEPGYYRAGAFGIRLENLVQVVEAAPLGDGRAQLAFETLTLCPLDRALLDQPALTRAEIDWLNAYHARVWQALSPRVSPKARAWLERACATLQPRAL